MIKGKNEIIPPFMTTIINQAKKLSTIDGSSLHPSQGKARSI